MPQRLRMTPPRTFAVISLVLIIVMVVATTLTQTNFYRQAIIDRESVIIRDMVGAMVMEQQQQVGFHSENVARYPDKDYFNQSFNVLKLLSGVVRIKVFDQTGTIVWSDEPQLIGTQSTRHKQDLARAMAGEARAVFHSNERAPDFADHLSGPVIEFYVPFFFSPQASGNATASGVVALYRSPEELNKTIRNGMLLLWLVTGLGGTILFFALNSLFRAVYFRQREAESQFAKLSTDHERLVQVEKLSAMGQMVSEIAHQLNNPLVGVINLAELAERETDNPPQTKDLLSEIRKAGNHCRDFVQRMLRFSHVAHSEPQLVELKSVVRETIAFFQQTVGGSPTVTFEAPADDVMMEVDPVLIRHALFNLIHNASLAKPGGTVVVMLALEQRGSVAGWRLTVADSGPGLLPEVADKLFTPFFTTRAGGTGLGLTVAQHIILQHGGNIRAENQLAGGALFVVWLPEKR
ncbi:MAG: ATP-binding protein [Sterolibacterium sp.]